MKPYPFSESMGVQDLLNQFPLPDGKEPLTDADRQMLKDAYRQLQSQSIACGIVATVIKDLLQTDTTGVSFSSREWREALERTAASRNRSQ